MALAARSPGIASAVGAAQQPDKFPDVQILGAKHCANYTSVRVCKSIIPDSDIREPSRFRFRHAPDFCYRGVVQTNAAYRIVKLANGAQSVYSLAYGEKMHPGLGPVAEAEAFASGN